MEAEAREVESYCVTCKKPIYSGEGRYWIDKVDKVDLYRCSDCGDQNFKPKFIW